MIREVLETSNDIAIDVDQLIVKYSPGQEICEGIKFNFAYMMLYGQPKLWQIYTLASLSKQKSLILSLRVDPTNPKAFNHKEVILEQLA